MAEDSATASPAPQTAPEAGQQVNGPPTPGHQPQRIIEASDFPEEGYVTASDTSSNASTSLSSSVRDYDFENKRRYHKFKEGRYAFPNDEPEQEREDMKHAMVLHLCDGKLHNAPLENPQKIIDIGTGTGIWAMDMGDEYPTAEIIGIDLSPIQPSYVPPNVHFIVDDAEAEWLYPDNSFDYVHLRHFFAKNWSKLLEQAYRVLKPGGWIEIQEFNWRFTCDDGTMSPDYAVLAMNRYIREGLAVMGVDMHAADTHPERVKSAGFVNEIVDIKKVPVGPWPKDPDLRIVGKYCQAAIYDGLHAITIGPLTRGLEWTSAEVEVFLISVRKALLDSSTHSYAFYHSVSAQKPVEKK